MKNIRVFRGDEFERPRCLTLGKSFENALQLPTVNTAISGNRAAIIGQRLKRHGMGLRQREQVASAVTKRFQRNERLCELVSQMLRRLEVAGRHEIARIIPVQLVARGLEGRKRVRKAG